MEPAISYEIDISKIREQFKLKASLTIPHISVVSDANLMLHWSKVHKKRIAHDSIIRLIWKSNKFHETVLYNKPYIIIFTRISPRKFDSDNLQMAFKGIRDTMADILIPGKKRGVADSDPRLTWIYDQVKGPKGIKIEVYDRK